MDPLELPSSYNAATHFLDRHVEEGRGDAIALLDADGEHSYAALAERSHRVAHALARLGVPRESRVLMTMLDTADFVTVFFGAIRHGAVPVPVNTLLTADDLAGLLDDSRAQTWVCSARLIERFGPAAEGRVMLERQLVAGGEADGWVSLQAELSQSPPEPYTSPPTGPDDVAFWLYSSGSTGRPKGAMHLMQDLVQTAHLYGQPILELTPDDVVYSAAKLFFAYGLGNAMTFPMHVGARAVLYEGRPTPEAVAEVFAQHQPTVFYGVPTLYAGLLASDVALDTSRLRRCVSAGEALPPDLYERWLAKYGVPILDGIGSTEMLHIFLSNRDGDVRPGTSGKPVPGYAVRVVDEAGELAPPGHVGELWVKGPTSAVAYWNQRARSLDTFHGPWTRTGDKYAEEDGYYRYVGRADDMMKVSGIWVSPFEVESCLVSHPRVLEAAVVAKRDDDDLIKPKAFVVLTGDAPSDDMAASLKAHVKAHLAPYKYPRWFEFVDELPKTATGKIQRFKLR